MILSEEEDGVVILVSADTRPMGHLHVAPIALFIQ